MTYSSAVEYLYGLQKHGIKLGLHNIRAVLDRLNHPERRYRSIHIAGTNGKGSTAAMVAAMVTAAGYRVGLYTSPHLVDFRERIRVDGAMIAEARVGELVDRLRLAGEDLPLTFFEFSTAMAFQYFADAMVDVAVLEVGMGGRYDATNVVEPVATAITSIGLDHEEYLGHTLEEIAHEKGGIIKPQVPLVMGRIDQGASQVIRALADQHDAPYYELGTAFRVYKADGGFQYDGLTREHRDLVCPLQGRHQLDNAACALALVEVVDRAGIVVGGEAVPRGLAATQWEGRLEVVEQNPTVLLDGAHNPEAARALAAYLADFRREHPKRQVVLILGMMRDKAHRSFAEILLPWSDHVIVTQAAIARAMPAQELCDLLSPLLSSIHTAATPADALARARHLVASSDLICVTGSLMLVGEMKALLRGWTLSSVRG